MTKSFFYYANIANTPDNTIASINIITIIFCTFGLILTPQNNYNIFL